jgi:hypothetical protein
MIRDTLCELPRALIDAGAAVAIWTAVLVLCLAVAS